MTPTSNQQPDCLSAEDLAAFIEGQTPAEDLARTKAHLATCDYCTEFLGEATLTLAELDEQQTPLAPVAVPPVEPTPLLTMRPRPQKVRRVTTWVAAAAGLAAVVVLALWLPSQVNRGPSGPIMQLVSAAGPERPTNGRLTGGFAWAPPAAALRSGEAPVLDTSPELKIADAQAQQAYRANRTPSTVAGYAVAGLFFGRVDDAVRGLEEATTEESGNASFWSDLAAAYMARSDYTGSTTDLPRALKAVDTALDLDGTHLEALFNRAMVLEKLNMPRAADAWRAYLARDSESEWAAEARTHLSRLARPAPESKNPQQLREELFDTALPEWAAATESGSAQPDFAGARQLVLALDRVQEDRFAADVLAAAEQAAEQGGTRLRTIAEGHRAYGVARRQLRTQGQSLQAESTFEQAVRSLERARSPLAFAARYYAARAMYVDDRLDPAGTRFLQLQRDMHGLPYPTIAGRVEWMLGLIAYRGSEFHKALVYYENARETLRRADEPSNEAFAAGLMAEVYDRLGDPDRAWRHRIEALGGTDRNGLLLSVARSAWKNGWVDLAAALQDDAIETAREHSEQANLVDALRNRALTDCELGDKASADQRLKEAQSLMQPGPQNWDRLHAEINLATALCSTPESAPAAVDAATAAEGYFLKLSRRGDTSRLPEVYRARARASRLAGRTDDARRDLHGALRILEDERARAVLPAARAELADSARLASDELVTLEIAAGDPDAALRAADWVRGWDLPVDAGQRGTVGIADMQLAMDTATTFAYYFVGSDASFVWIVRKSGSWLERIPAGRAELSRLLDRSLGGPAADHDPERIRELLLSPVERHLATEDLLVIAPDGPLHRLAFAAMRVGPDRFLIEDHPLVLAPGARAYLRATQLAESFSALPRDVVSVGNPSIDRARFPRLPALPWAEDEARAIAAEYPGKARLLIGPDAERGRVLDAMGSVDVAHFALHAVLDDAEPGQSELVLRSENGARLTAKAISTLSWPRLRLVVLAACRSLGGRATTTLGPMGLARAFVQAGIPTVIASHWDVDDRASRQLLTAFHREFARTGDVARSLRKAQVDMLRSSDAGFRQPERWAGLVAIGGQRRLTI